MIAQNALITLFSAVFTVLFPAGTALAFDMHPPATSRLAAAGAPLLQAEALIIIRDADGNYRSVLPPSATPVHVTKFIGDAATPEEFIADVSGEMPVSASFALDPDIHAPGEQNISILLTDAYGNTTMLASTLTLVHDTEPPVISGLLHKTIFVGDTIAYRKGIIVTDNRDIGIPPPIKSNIEASPDMDDFMVSDTHEPEVALTIDSSAVDRYTEGEYPVIYTATDSSGNTSTVQGTVTVLGVSLEQVNDMADAILLDILEEDMSLASKARAIYKWVRDQLDYVNSSIKDDPMIAAYRGLKHRSGDCFVFASVAELLLTRAGIENVLIERNPVRRTRHYWSLVNIGTGWYHFDTTPHHTGGSCILFTETKLRALEETRGRNYYAYDHSLYPEAVK